MKKLEENKIKTREQNKGRKIKTLLSSPIHLAHHHSTVEPLSLCCCTDIATLSHRYRTAIVPLLLRRCCSVVALLSHRYRTGIAPLSLRCCCSCCRYAVTLLSHRYCSTVAPLLSLLLSLRSRTAIAPLSRRCRTAVAPAQRGYTQFKIELLVLYCHSNVASSADRKVHTVVASRAIIRVMVTIGDCQARVSSSSEGCSTSQKTIKVETY